MLVNLNNLIVNTYNKTLNYWNKRVNCEDQRLLMLTEYQWIMPNFVNR